MWFAWSFESVHYVMIVQDYSFKEHEEMYDFAGHHAPIKMIHSATAPAAAVTTYPEYTVQKYVSHPAVNITVAVISVALKSTQRTFLSTRAIKIHNSSAW